MNVLGEVLRGPQAARLGWTLLHLLWQGALVWTAAAVVLVFLRKRGPAGRYLAATAGLLILAAAPVVTFFAIGAAQPQATPAAVAPETAAWTADVEVAGEPASVLPPVFESPSVAPVDEIVAPELPPVPLRHRIEGALQPWLPHIVVGWLMGVLLLTAWRTGGWVQVRRLKRQCTSEVPAGLRATLAALAARLRVSRPVRLVQSGIATVPTVIGWLRPVILLPTAALTGLTPEQLEAVLAHELAHIRRHDGLVNTVQAVVEMLLFYHPAVWWLSRRMRIEREQCCDDVAVAACGGGVLYGRALAAMEALRAAPSPGLSARGGDLLARVRRIVAKPDAREGASSSRWLPGVLTVAVVLAVAAVPLVTGGTAAAEGGAAVEGDTETADRAKDEALPQFTATLPNGVTVELIGVSYHPSAGRPWWAPDGEALAEAPYDETESRENENAKVEFAVRLSGAASQDATLRWGTSRGNGWASLGKAYQSGETVPNVRAVAVYGLEPQGQTDVTLRLAAGPWRTHVTKQNRGSYGMIDNSGTVRFTETMETEGKVVVVAADTICKGECRIVVIDAAGTLHLPTDWSCNDAGGLRLSTATFRGVSLEDVQELRYQLRDFQDVEFRNVSLQPGQKTDVQVVVEPIPEGDAPRSVAGAAPLSAARKVDLPDFGTAHEVLDLSSGELIQVQGASNNERMEALANLKRGDLGYGSDRDPLLFLLGEASTSYGYVTITGGGVTIKQVSLPAPLPVDLIVTGRDGGRYRVRVKAAGPDGCSLEYSTFAGPELPNLSDGERDRVFQLRNRLAEMHLELIRAEERQRRARAGLTRNALQSETELAQARGQFAEAQAELAVVQEKMKALQAEVARLEQGGAEPAGSDEKEQDQRPAVEASFGEAAGQAVREFVEAAVRGDDEAVVKMFPNPPDGRIQTQTEPLRQIAQLNPEWHFTAAIVWFTPTDAFVADGQDVVANPGVGQRGRICFTMRYKDDRWQIADGDLEDVAGLASEIERFRARHPDAVEWTPGAREAATALTFGPVIERVVSQGTRGLGAFIDLDTAKVFVLPPEIKNQETERIYDWVRRQGIDARISYDGQGLSIRPFDASVGFEEGEATRVTWETITAKSLRELNYDSVWDVTGRVPILGKEPRVQRITEYQTIPIDTHQLPAAAWFKTREGGIGILQIVALTEDPPGVRIRYKMLQTTPPTSEVTGHAGAPAVAAPRRPLPDAPFVSSVDVDDWHVPYGAHRGKVVFAVVTDCPLYGSKVTNTILIGPRWEGGLRPTSSGEGAVRYLCDGRTLRVAGDDYSLSEGWLFVVTEARGAVEVHQAPSPREPPSTEADLRDVVHGPIRIPCGTRRMPGTAAGSASVWTAALAGAEPDPKLKAKLVFNGAEARDGGTYYSWQLERDAPSRISHGWYSIADGVLREYVGGGLSQIASSGRGRLAVTVLGADEDDGKLQLRMSRANAGQDDRAEAAMTTATAWPPGAILLGEACAQPLDLVNHRYAKLWRGDFIRDGKIVKTVVYAARVVAPDDPTQGFVPPAPRGPDAILAFRLVADQPGPDTVEVADPQSPGETMNVLRDAALDGRQVRSAQVVHGTEPDRWSVEIELTAEGTERLEKVTEANIGKRLAVFVGDRCVSAPFIREALRGGAGIISGNFTREEAEALAAALQPQEGQPPAPTANIPERTVVTGVVTRASDGSPVAGVGVELWNTQAQVVAGNLADEKGAFNVAPDRPGNFMLVARSQEWFSKFDGLPFKQIRLAEGETAHVDIQVVPAGAFASTATDGASGLPLVGIEVSGLRGLMQATTGEDGKFRIAGLPPGFDLPFTITGPGYGIASAQVRVNGGAELVRQFTLSPEGVFTGRVTDEDGQPIQGVEVYCVSENRGFPDYWQRLTDEQGRYELHRINRGVPYRVTAKKEGYASETKENVVFPNDGETLTLDFVLKAGFDVSGRVVDGDGKPIPGVAVHWGRTNAYGHQDVATDRDGRFRFQGLITKYPETVYAVAEGYGIASQKVDPQDKEAAGNVVLVLKRELWISGEVVDEQGKPVPNARVVVGRASGGFRSATTDENGGFTLTQFEPGEYPITVVAPGYVIDERNVVNAGTMDARVVVRKSVAIQGRVVDARTGQAVKQFNIRLAWPLSGVPPGGISASLMEKGLELQQADGKFEMGPSDPDASYRLIVVAPGYAVGDVDSVKPGEPVDVLLTKAKPVTVHVVNEDTGKDVDGAEVRFYFYNRAEALSDHSLSARNLPAISIPAFHPQRAEAGSYTFANVGAGVWILEVTATGFERHVTAFRQGVAEDTIEVPLRPAQP